jgi:hypothetical protein
VKVQYTLPGYQPELKSAAEASEFLPARFQNTIPSLNGQPLTTLSSVLALDRTIPDPELLAPPQQSSSPPQDPAVERQLWRDILTRHNQPTDIAQMQPAARQMLALLQDYQQTESMLFMKGLFQDQPL